MAHSTQMADGGSGPTHTPITSSITVDPGQVKEFASFLAQMREELDSLHKRMDGLEVTPEHFGVHRSSKTAGDKHHAALRAAIDNLSRLCSRTDEITDGTNQISRLYSDVEELNTSNANSITDAMNSKGDHHG